MIALLQMQIEQARRPSFTGNALRMLESAISAEEHHTTPIEAHIVRNSVRIGSLTPERPRSASPGKLAGAESPYRTAIIEKPPSADLHMSPNLDDEHH